MNYYTVVAMQSWGVDMLASNALLPHIYAAIYASSSLWSLRCIVVSSVNGNVPSSVYNK